MERFSRRQGFRLMLGAAQAVLVGVAGGAPAGYAATATGLPGLLAYWRCSDPDVIRDATPGDRVGAYNGPVALVAGLPTESDAATHLPGTVVGTVLHDAGLALPAMTLSLWVKLPALPAARTAIVSKDQSGFLDGDFAVTVDELGELITQFQSSSAEYRISHILTQGTVHHIVVTADATGFQLWVDGRHIGKEVGFTNAWTNNSQPIRFASVPWSSTILEMLIDEIALYGGVLPDAGIIGLSQRTAAPTAANDSFVAPESVTTILDVVSNGTWIGRKEDLTVEVLTQPTHGTATVRADNDIDFEAAAVSADQADSFTYRISDANRASNIATMSGTVQNAASEGGGTLVYDWQPQASWIDGVALAGRDGNDINANVNNWPVTGASVGGSLVKSLTGDTGLTTQYCWNRAPTGHPSLEMYVPAGSTAGNTIIGRTIQLYDQFVGSPRHLRVVMEVKTCKLSDPTTHKANGVGPTSGSYTDWGNTHAGAAQAAVKYFIGMTAGNVSGPHGGGRCNWWNGKSLATPTFPTDRLGVRIQSAASGKTLATYAYFYDRPGKFGYFKAASARLDDVGVEGVWHRIEIELKLATPESVPSNALYSDPPTTPSNTGDAFVKHYLTKDIDGEFGMPGAREEIVAASGFITFCKTDNVFGNNNMHTVANILGPWINYYYGGSVGSQGAGWSWIRRIQVYRHD